MRHDLGNKENRAMKINENVRNLESGRECKKLRLDRF
jgi:hypothetical protein